MTIDLHGLTVLDAEIQTNMALLTFEQDDFETELEIITGKGTGAVFNAVSDYLIKEGYNFEIINNGGCIFITKEY